MLDWTDRHYRYLVRLISHHALLYTEMIHAQALLHGSAERYLAYDPKEQPLVLQLGGSFPEELAKAVHVASSYTFAAINLNAGCPSPRVQKASFGAALMLDKTRLINCLNAMQDKTDTPITLKHRLGVDKETSYDFVRDFVGDISEKTSCRTFIVHARNAWLQGLSPKANRETPPLNYSFVYYLKKDFPNLTIVLNGGINNLEVMQEVLTKVDGVMVGRKAFHDPWFLASWDQTFFSSSYFLSREKWVEAFYQYACRMLQEGKGTNMRDLARPAMNFFHGEAGARVWRQVLSDSMLLKKNDPEIIIKAYRAVKEISSHF